MAIQDSGWQTHKKDVLFLALRSNGIPLKKKEEGIPTLEELAVTNVERYERQQKIQYKFFVEGRKYCGGELLPPSLQRASCGGVSIRC